MKTEEIIEILKEPHENFALALIGGKVRPDARARYEDSLAVALQGLANDSIPNARLNDIQKSFLPHGRRFVSTKCGRAIY
jgi:selenophosphate synthetase-related protein